MLPGVVVLVSDQPNRSAALAEALRGVGRCELVGPDVNWSARETAIAVVTDLDLTRPAAMQCLLGLRTQPWAETCPLLCIAHRTSDKALRQAQVLGASACLPYYAEPHIVVTALLNLINPDEGSLNATVRQCAERAGAALTGLFATAGTNGRVDLQAIDTCVDPLLLALSDGGLSRWLNTIRAHDNATYQHSLVVAGLAAQFATHIGFPEAQRQRLVRAALVHDVGKARIPRDLLLKRGSLDAAEAAIMRTHAILGYEILRASGGADPAMLDAVRHHHEMLDGSGYPDGISGDAISDVVRFLTICDIYAALTERRSYKPAMTPDEAMGILQGMQGRIETRFVQAFGKAVARAA
ncbi:HD-GYP domain-containing protein [Methylobacterium durans]|uniref:Phosphohydrolase n=1 Tax=Methylobacterium durans TaxID=2202825 RepID=A0A2U8W2U9_9HYPH|nr:HD domain-containing phosphohydrolase [Methylobacterium durans]AWN40424.1 phosphohydrolase [Methylobacterium durans]